MTLSPKVQMRMMLPRQKKRAKHLIYVAQPII
jgi:hypothetical protein